MKSQSFSYRQFLDSEGHSSITKQITDITSVIDDFKLKDAIASRFASTTFLLDYSTKKYLYVEESCFNVLGYKAKWFLDSGLEEFITRWHPCDYHLFNTKVFHDNISFLSTIPFGEYNSYVFSYNYRFRNPNDQYCTILQRFYYVPGNNCTQPAGVIGVAFDISHYKTDSSIVHTIEKVTSTEHGLINELVFKKIHPVYDDEKHQRISKREIEILKCMALGLSSKQIADKLSISVNTINNHRRNMLRKMEFKSCAEVINHAVKHGLI